MTCGFASSRAHDELKTEHSHTDQVQSIRNDYSRIQFNAHGARTEPLGVDEGDLDPAPCALASLWRSQVYDNKARQHRILTLHPHITSHYSRCCANMSAMEMFSLGSRCTYTALSHSIAPSQPPTTRTNAEISMLDHQLTVA